MNRNVSLKKGQVYLLNVYPKYLTKRGLEVVEHNNDDKYDVDGDSGMIYGLDGRGQKVRIRYFPKLTWSLEEIIKRVEELDAKSKAIRDMKCPDDKGSKAF